MAGLMEGKRVMVFGVANERSIAWGIARAMREHGARLGFNYVGEAIERRVRPLAESLDAEVIVPCDVRDDAQVTAAFESIGKIWGGLDVLVHSLAFANRADLDGEFYKTERDGFLTALDVSAYSLVQLTREAVPLMADGGAVITMTYLGAERVVPNYNVMGVAKAALEASVRYLAADLGPKGIRINAVSAGPIKTLAASGVRNLRALMAGVEERTPLRRGVTQEDIGRTSVYLCSDLAAGVTGEVVHVDLGYSIMAF